MLKTNRTKSKKKKLLCNFFMVSKYQIVTIIYYLALLVGHTSNQSFLISRRLYIWHGLDIFHSSERTLLCWSVEREPNTGEIGTATNFRVICIQLFNLSLSIWSVGYQWHDRHSVREYNSSQVWSYPVVDKRLSYTTNNCAR